MNLIRYSAFVALVSSLSACGNDSSKSSADGGTPGNSNHDGSKGSGGGSGSDEDGGGTAGTSGSTSKAGSSGEGGSGATHGGANDAGALGDASMGGYAGGKGTGGNAGDSGPSGSYDPAKALPEGAAQFDVDMSGHDEVLLDHLICSGWPERGMSGGLLSDTPASIVTSDGYAFLTTPPTPDVLDRETSHTARCTIGGEKKDWQDYQDPEPNYTNYYYPMNLGAYAGGGAVYGINNTLAAGNSSRVFGKFVDAVLTWQDNYTGFLKFGSGPNLVTSGGGFAYAIATAAQLPMEPPGMTAKPVLVKYSADGTRQWIQRFDSALNDHLVADAEGNIYFASSKPPAGVPATSIQDLHVVRMNPDASAGWDQTIPVRPTGAGISVLSVAVSGDALFVLTTGEQVTGGPESLHLAKLRLKDGATLFRSEARFSNSKIIDPIEQVEWDGHHLATGMYNKWAVASLAGGGACITGQYANTYKNGSMPRHPHVDTLIACFDDTGVYEWARQYRVAFAPVAANQTEPSLYPTGIAEQGDGTLMVAAEQSIGGGPAVFAVDAKGTPK